MRNALIRVIDINTTAFVYYQRRRLRTKLQWPDKALAAWGDRFLVAVRQAIQPLTTSSAEAMRVYEEGSRDLARVLLKVLMNDQFDEISLDDVRWTPNRQRVLRRVGSIFLRDGWRHLGGIRVARQQV